MMQARYRSLKAIKKPSVIPTKMTAGTKSAWFIPTGLIALSIVPVLAGAARLFQLGSGEEITPENARFFESPLPVVAHLISTTVYCILGAFQFAPGFRRRNPRWHRSAGRILVPCGIFAALTGLWMTQFFPRGIEPPASFDGPYVYVLRLLAGSAMALALCFGVAAVRRRDIPRHRAWMMRGYAFGIGAGTQVLTHLPWFLFPSIQGETARTIFMGAGWAINLVVVEWILLRERCGRSS
jgi:uncharacterized membrane protein